MNRCDHASMSFRCRWLCGLAVAAGLAACGGGGGGGDDAGPPGNIDISTANREPVTRAAMVTVQGGGIGGSLGIAGGGASPAAAGLRRALLAGLRGGGSARESAAALLGPERLDCAVSGFATITLDDRDNDQQGSVGDVLAITFSACSDVAGETLDGALSATYTQVVSAPLAVGASVSTSTLVLAEPGYSARLDGAFAFTAQETSADVATLRIVAANSLALRVITPVYTDTVTMQDGYTIAITEDLSATPPGGGSAGRSTTTVGGRVTSAAAGGTVQVRTTDPFVQYTDDDYPRAGAIEALGGNGSLLQAQVLSTAEVRIDVDSNGDGTTDATRTLPWTQLL